MVGCHPWIGCAQELGQPLFFSLHSAARQASHPNCHLLGFMGLPPSCLISRVSFSKTPGPPQGFEEAPSGGPGGDRAPAGQRTPRTKATPQKRKPQKAKRKGLPSRGGLALGLGRCVRKAGQAYAGCLVLSSMVAWQPPSEWAL